MPKTTLVLFAAAVAAATVLAQPPAARAASTVCRTVNGSTVCSQSGDALSCQTVNGQTLCLSGPGTMRCETVNGRTACSTARGVSPRPAPALPGDQPDGWPKEWDDEPMPEPVLPKVGPGAAERNLTIERDGRGLRVRVDSLDLRLDGFP